MTAQASRLPKAQKGRIKQPLRFVFYGAEGVGKSTLAAFAPSPIWLDCEDGSGRLDVSRYAFRDGEGGHVPHSYAEVLAAIEDLTANPHDYKTLVIDTADRLEALLWKHMCVKAGKGYQSVEDWGYGKGYVIAVDEWRDLCLRLDRLRAARGMSIILLAHAQIRTFKNPTGEDYDRYWLRINEKAGGFIKEWSDVTGFAAFEEGSSKLIGSGSDRARGYSTGRRLLKLKRTAAYDAKTRYAMPDEIELDPANPWAPLAKELEDSAGMDAPALGALINAEVARIGGGDVVRKKVDTAVTKAAGDTETLHRILNELKKKEPIEPKEEV